MAGLAVIVNKEVDVEISHRATSKDIFTGEGPTGAVSKDLPFQYQPSSKFCSRAMAVVMNGQSASRAKNT